MTKHRSFTRYLSDKELFDVPKAVRYKINDVLNTLFNVEKYFPNPIQDIDKIGMQLKFEYSVVCGMTFDSLRGILKEYGFSETDSSVEIWRSLPKGAVEMIISWEEPEDPLYDTWIKRWFSEREERTENMFRNRHLEIKKVIFNEPATIVLWNDGTKTVVKTHGKEKFDPEKGLAMAISKKVLGTNESGSNYYDVFENWISAFTERKLKNDNS